jgi:hypothetical protein
MTRDAARIVLAAYPNAHGAQISTAHTDRALRATIRHGIRQYSWSIISVITAELPSCERCGLERDAEKCARFSARIPL